MLESLLALHTTTLARYTPYRRSWTLTPRLTKRCIRTIARCLSRLRSLSPMGYHLLWWLQRSHTFLYYHGQIWKQARRSMQEQPDIHARLMAHYPQVPEWWYCAFFVIFVFRFETLTFFAVIMFAFVSITVWYTKVNYSYDIKVKLPV